MKEANWENPLSIAAVLFVGSRNVCYASALGFVTFLWLSIK